MTTIVPEYSKGQVDAAGAALVNPQASIDELEDALTVVNKWRAMHSFPLNTFQKTLRRKAKDVDGQSLVAQRIKRLSSIELKLNRFPQMKSPECKISEGVEQ